ncbi:MAG: NAD(P)H-hydrate epimerase [bacterium]|nr:NAD(P)H-hydrate epimerase [bacterium]
MRPLFPPELMRDFDARATSEYGIPGLLLMENAAQRLLELIAAELGPVDQLSVGIFCGPGNNGGDGLALARLLYLRGADVEVWLLAPADVLRGDARTNFEICTKLEVPLYQPVTLDEIAFEEYDVVVDALFGTGAVRAPVGLYADVITTLNDLDIPVLAVDVPSGIDAGTGVATTPAVQATWTVTFETGKPGLYLPPGRQHAGDVRVSPISLPISIDAMVASQWFLPDDSDVVALFPPRARDSHKGNYGRLLIIAGSRGMSGAARLAASAALRTGVGLLMVAVPESVRPEVASQSELMTVGLPGDDTGRLDRCRMADARAVLEMGRLHCLGSGLGPG